MSNEEVRRSMSFGIGSPQDPKDMQFRIVHKDIDLQTWEKIVLELVEWPRDEL